MAAIASITSDKDRDELDREIAECERYEERAAFWKIPADPVYAAKLRGQREANLRGLERLKRMRDAA